MFIVLMSSISEGAEFIQVICILLFWFLLYWFLLAQSTKRCHDVGYNGWFQLIPLFNVYLLFFANSELGINKYGVNPKGQNSSLDDAVEYYNRGFENRRLRKYNEAISDYKKSIELSPDDADTFNNLGYCYLEMQNYDDAKNSFLKCLEIDGKYIDSLIGISILYYEEQKFDESKLWMQKAIDLKPILREGMEGLKKLEEDGWIYKEENKAVIKKVFNLFLQTLSIKSN
jgi:tetratricopeptide (TPR) repeat protein